MRRDVLVIVGYVVFVILVGWIEPIVDWIFGG